MPTRTKARTKAKPRVDDSVDHRLIKALGHPVRVHSLAILNERIASPNELAKELGEGLSQVSYHVKVLSECECIELVKTEPRRGAVEHYYRATARAFFTDRDWQRFPKSIRPGMSVKLVGSIVDEAAAALEGETFDARDDRHLSCTPMTVDEEGWSDVIGVLSDALDRVLTIRAASRARLAKAGEEGIPISVSMLGFEAPQPDEMPKKPRSGS